MLGDTRDAMSAAAAKAAATTQKKQRRNIRFRKVRFWSLASTHELEGRRKSVLASDAHERGSGALSSRSCGNDGSHATSASENELMSSLIRRLTEAVSRSPSVTGAQLTVLRCDRNANSKC